MKKMPEKYESWLRAMLDELEANDRETVITQGRDDRQNDTLRIYTDNPTVARRILNDGHEPENSPLDIGMFFTIKRTSFKRSWLA